VSTATTATPFRESTNFLRGRAGEQTVKCWLQKRGWWVIPSYDYTGENGDKAPRMQGLSSSLIIPDLDIAKTGLRRWAEVKTKTKANHRWTTDTYEHGIDRRHYEHYLRVQEITGAHVWLFIVEENTQTILAESLDRLGKPRFGCQYGKDGMANWPRDHFSIKVPISGVPGI
jgi:hypothetical protein